MRKLQKVLSIILIFLLVLSLSVACSKKGELPDDRSSDPVRSEEVSSSEESKTDESRGEESESQSEYMSGSSSEDSDSESSEDDDRSSGDASSTDPDTENPSPTDRPTFGPTPTTAPKPTSKPSPTPDPSKLTGVNIDGIADELEILTVMIKPSTAKVRSYQWMVSDKPGGPYYDLPGRADKTLILDSKTFNIIEELEDAGKVNFTDAPLKPYFKVKVTDTSGKSLISDYVDFQAVIYVGYGKPYGGSMEHGTGYGGLAEYKEGQTDTITATPYNGWKFSYWKIEAMNPTDPEPIIAGFDKYSETNTFTIKLEHFGMKVFAIFEEIIPGKINNAKIGGFVIPKKGATPITVAALKTTHPGFSITKLTWYDLDTEKPFTGSKFVHEDPKKYYAGIELTAKAGYFFEGNTWIDNIEVNLPEPWVATLSGSGPYSGERVVFQVHGGIFE